MKLISVFLALVSLVSGHIIQADIRIHPEKYNLMTIDTSNLPEPVEAPTADDFVQLSEVNMHYRIYGEGRGAAYPYPRQRRQREFARSGGALPCE